MKHIYLYEFQVQMSDDITYLPYASGLLVAYTKAHAKPGEFEFHINEPVLFPPDFIAYSVSLWNLKASESHASQLHEIHPNATFIFGGPSAREIKLPFYHLNTFAEGETVFSEIVTGRPQLPLKTLDQIPSPYVMGVFDELVRLHPNCQAIIETTRGCSFGCTYCYWGKNSDGFLFRSPTAIREEAEWLAQHKVKYVFCADGNFGIFPKDKVVATIYADVKTRYGYPEKFRVCYGKNAENNIFQCAQILSQASLAKTVTISRQSTNSATLEAIGRKNVSQETFDSLQERYQDANIPTYTELILGLPEETYQSFKDGIAKSIREYDTQLLIYPCEVLPGTKLADPEYQKQYGIHVTKTILTPVHALPLQPIEYENIVTETRTMTKQDWINSFVLSRMAQLFYSLKVLRKIPDISLWERWINFDYPAISPILWEIIANFYSNAFDILDGGGRCKVIYKYGDILWEPEEIAFFKIAEYKPEFFAELKKLLPKSVGIIEQCEAEFPELKADDDPKEFARQTILYGRKSGSRRGENHDNTTQ